MLTEQGRIMRIKINWFKHVVFAAVVTVPAFILPVRQAYAQDASGTLHGCTETLSLLAQDADMVLNELRQTDIELSGPSYSLSEITGLGSQNWYETGCTDIFHTDKMKADIRDKFRMSPEDYYIYNSILSPRAKDKVGELRPESSLQN